MINKQQYLFIIIISEEVDILIIIISWCRLGWCRGWRRLGRSSWGLGTGEAIRCRSERLDVIVQAQCVSK